jgi:hypothetical protein
MPVSNFTIQAKYILKICCFLLTKNGVDAVVLALDNELCHDHHVLGVHRPVSDPVLLRQRVRGVHDEFCNNNKSEI